MCFILLCLSKAGKCLKLKMKRKKKRKKDVVCTLVFCEYHFYCILSVGVYIFPFLEFAYFLQRKKQLDWPNPLRNDHDMTFCNLPRGGLSNEWPFWIVIASLYMIWDWNWAKTTKNERERERFTVNACLNGLDSTRRGIAIECRHGDVP